MLPPHFLKLKTGTTIILLGNIKPPNLCNKTGLQVQFIRDKVIGAIVLTGQAVGQTTKTTPPRKLINCERSVGCQIERGCPRGGSRRGHLRSSPNVSPVSQRGGGAEGRDGGKKKNYNTKNDDYATRPLYPPETVDDGAKYSYENKGTREVEDVPNKGAVAAGALPAKLVVEVKPEPAAVARESDVGVFTALEAVGDFARRASLKDEIGRPSMPASGRPMPVDLSVSTPWSEPRDTRSARLDAHPTGRLAASIGTLAMEARAELEGLRNISREIKESVIAKLAAISELALRLEESRSSYIVELERERTRRSREAEAAQKRIAKIAKENLDRILQIENKLDKTAEEVSSTRNLLGHFDVLEKLEAIQKTLETGTAPRALKYPEVAAKPKLLAAAPKRISGLETRTGAGHTLPRGSITTLRNRLSPNYVVWLMRGKWAWQSTDFERPGTKGRSELLLSRRCEKD
ncbi:hypothetical protein EVAR_34093_1 [Eumeta japonica]|uniref:DNA helicase Pif1-like 2B domain-containing protein n=1 Tax=Eumeta variegata TaxID=151549 RepID=A0A4C1WMG0_EUMVA|nr:hypothetical protein EVAR_34093_1 [Eumeta japonica]